MDRVCLRRKRFEANKKRRANWISRGVCLQPKRLNQNHGNCDTRPARRQLDSTDRWWRPRLARDPPDPARNATPAGRFDRANAGLARLGQVPITGIGAVRTESGLLYARSVAQQWGPDHIGWFEALYQSAHGNPRAIYWATERVSPLLVEWERRVRLRGVGRRALVIGCGIGDDAEELARTGFETTAFDVSASAIAWCKRRFPRSAVSYEVANLFAPWFAWTRRFDFVLESGTLEVIPQEERRRAMSRMAEFVGVGGQLLVITRGREPADHVGALPWRLSASEVRTFRNLGLREVGFEDLRGPETPAVRRFRVEFRR
ncbi:MAG: class I SAM-dependent methyltransferase [Candidatus Rokubacteria bacterium]|nr:class I SAM-dependent methyltransferase [Candidatus Rokubacteria bacterium]